MLFLRVEIYLITAALVWVKEDAGWKVAKQQTSVYRLGKVYCSIVRCNKNWICSFTWFTIQGNEWSKLIVYCIPWQFFASDCVHVSDSNCIFCCPSTSIPLRPSRTVFEWTPSSSSSYYRVCWGGWNWCFIFLQVSLDLVLVSRVLLSTQVLFSLVLC